MKFALGIGVVFQAGRIANVIMLLSPFWFTVVDLVGVYIPVGYLVGKLVVRNNAKMFNSVTGISAHSVGIQGIHHDKRFA